LSPNSAWGLSMKATGMALKLAENCSMPPRKAPNMTGTQLSTMD
jgi:hypothetical protein